MSPFLLSGRKLFSKSFWQRVAVAVFLTIQMVAVIGPQSTQAAGLADEVQDELIVVFKDAERSKAPDSHAKAGTTVKRQLGLKPVHIVKAAAGQRETARQQYLRDPRVRLVEPNVRVRAAALPNDPRFAEQWGLTTIDAPEAWSSATGTGILIGVVDTGVDPAHPELIGRIAASANFSTAATVIDRNGHGTHIAAAIAGQMNNGIGGAGIAPDSRLLIARALDDQGEGTYADVIESINWAADSGAKIINLSLAGPTASQALAESIKDAQDRGVLIVAAAGNNGNGAQTYPAAYPGVVSVAATDAADAPAAFTTFGPWVTLGAPGVNVFSALPGNKYGTLSGSSAAAAYVSGVAALAWSVGAPDAGAVREALVAGAEPVGWRGIAFQAGRVNAQRTVDIAKPAVAPSPIATVRATTLGRINGSSAATNDPRPFVSVSVTVRADGTGLGNVSYQDRAARVQFTASRIETAVVEGENVRLTGSGSMRGSTVAHQFQMFLTKPSNGSFSQINMQINGPLSIGYHTDMQIPLKRIRATGFALNPATPTPTRTATTVVAATRTTVASTPVRTATPIPPSTASPTRTPVTGDGGGIAKAASASVTVTVRDTANVVRPGLTVWSYNGTTYASMGTTNASGQVTLTLADNTYSFRSQYNGVFFFSNPTPNCTVPSCTTGTVIVNVPTQITVVDDVGAPISGLTVTGFNGTTNFGMGATNASGITSATLASNTYAFRVTHNSQIFWSNPTPNCAVPTCASATITANRPVTVTVLDDGGVPQANLPVYAFDGTSYIFMGNSNGGGVVSRSLPSTTYTFRATYGGVYYWSNPTPNCVVPGCTSVTLPVASPVTVTVTDSNGAVIANAPVYAYNGSTYVRTIDTTDVNGQAIGNVVVGSYRFATDYNGTRFYSNTVNHCTVPGCANVSISVPAPVRVTVRDDVGTAIGAATINVYNGTTLVQNMPGTTNGSGEVTASIPTGTYRFASVYNGTRFYSNTVNHCTIPGCANASITANRPTTVTVTDNNGAVQLGLTVYASDGTNLYNMGVTNTAGQVTFSLLTGTYRFRTAYNGNNFWSNPTPNCATPGCFSGSIVVNAATSVTVLDGNGAAVPNIAVAGFDGPTYWSMGNTNGSGVASASLPSSTYSFRALYQGSYFFSNPTPNCVVPSALAAQSR